MSTFTVVAVVVVVGLALLLCGCQPVEPASVVIVVVAGQHGQPLVQECLPAGGALRGFQPGEHFAAASQGSALRLTARGGRVHAALACSLHVVAMRPCKWWPWHSHAALRLQMVAMALA